MKTTIAGVVVIVALLFAYESNLAAAPETWTGQIGDSMLSPTMPFEKASRSPWFMNWRGT